MQIKKNVDGKYTRSGKENANKIGETIKKWKKV